MTTANALNRRGSAEEVYALLRRRISLGEYPPGTRLKELTLSEELGISRSPIRAAFQRLEDDGMLLSAPNRGVLVAPWTDSDNDEVFDLRAHLESHAAALAAERRDDEHVKELEALNSKMSLLIQSKHENFLTDIQDVNRRFHQIIVSAARSPRLSHFVATLIDVRRVTGSFLYYTDEELSTSVNDHISITRAIERKNANLARALMDDHIRATWKRLKIARRNSE
ncbi:GntR family transcriptional regulator [Herbaspirillum sp. 1130]|uniref:GntR family transcriptional regulator n=1 Tax=Herbaspirillum sp. 1130 TaxID=2806562 RepID=UPI001AE19A99|nr:GntR family transcriptional regulator [Herbaspirillum sp. 1130]MBP1318295.1 DNA-binding GntR family transcriptional regulator [Herbaspirillum sp. 1130]